ncbi:glycoside hydrolase 100 family protein [uncultured Desulfobacter sp.]|uniref:glycoside hydrolase 100 family protein n=1 Tax=uncultured Desulfobacter sp. TaxID=240139 RepID=UPI002AAB5555|nr:glycoside hydrolase 100 family protein [uncultured Desulfobacter sp.]
MEEPMASLIGKAKQAALDVLLHNSQGPFFNLPRTAGWGYPEAYTRDLMIASLGILVTGNKTLINSLRHVFQVLSTHQTPLGHIPSIVHDPNECGASDTTPLFLMALQIFRDVTGDAVFLEEAAAKARTWMLYQSPTSQSLVAQMPTSDWRDEQWVLGYGLFVNTIVYSYLKLFGLDDQAGVLKQRMTARLSIKDDNGKHGKKSGLGIKFKPYFALWSYKMYNSERFDLLGNSLAILSGIASPSKALQMISWTEDACQKLKSNGELAVDLPPNFFPYIHPGDDDWRPRYSKFNLPGDYHNGGIWPFVCGFYIAALTAAGRHRLAEKKFESLTRLIQPARRAKVDFGFNEWVKAQDGKPKGQDWQTWSAAMYLYAAECIKRQQTPFFDTIRAKADRR